MNLPLFTLQIMPWAINSFQLLANRSIPVEVNMEYLQFTFRYLKFNWRFSSNYLDFEPGVNITPRDSHDSVH